MNNAGFLQSILTNLRVPDFYMANVVQPDTRLPGEIVDINAVQSTFAEEGPETAKNST